MSAQQVARLRTTESGNVVIVAGSTEIEMTPEHVDAFVAQLLHRAHPREHLFVIPVPR